MARRGSGLPGGVGAPAILFAAGFGVFAVASRNPDLVDLGPHVSAAGIGVFAASAGLLWLLVAIAKRPPPDRG